MCARIIISAWAPLSTSYDLGVKVHFSSTTASELSPPYYVCRYGERLAHQESGAALSKSMVTAFSALGLLARGIFINRASHRDFSLAVTGTRRFFCRSPIVTPFAAAILQGQWE